MEYIVSGMLRRCCCCQKRQQQERRRWNGKHPPHLGLSLRSLSQKMKRQALHVIEKQNGVDHACAHFLLLVYPPPPPATRDLRYAATAQRAYFRQLQPTKQQ